MTAKPIAAASMIILITSSIASAELKVEPDKDNVVSSRHEGRWNVDDSINKRLGQNQSVAVEFKDDKTVVESIPDKYEKFLGGKTIYMAGTITFYMPGPKKRNIAISPFILIEHKGNPHVVFFREWDGDPFGDGESFNVMLAVAKDKENDLLFVGGDFNNQPFTAYQRVVDDEQ